tara:strand:- start:30 stop:146 length:117 start_codon:yes stop_codon:yes gene_type:complete
MTSEVIIFPRKIYTCVQTAKENNESIGSEIAFPIAANI